MSVLDTAPALDVLAGVDVRVSPYADGVPLETRCRLAAASNSPTGGVLLVTAAELATMQEAFAAPPETAQ